MITAPTESNRGSGTAAIVLLRNFAFLTLSSWSEPAKSVEDDVIAMVAQGAVGEYVAGSAVDEAIATC